MLLPLGVAVFRLPVWRPSNSQLTCFCNNAFISPNIRGGEGNLIIKPNWVERVYMPSNIYYMHMVCIKIYVAMRFNFLSKIILGSQHTEKKKERQKILKLNRKQQEETNKNLLYMIPVQYLHAILIQSTHIVGYLCHLQNLWKLKYPRSLSCSSS